MTDRIALIIAILIVVAVIFDLMLRDGETLFFLAQKGYDLIHRLAVWR